MPAKKIRILIIALIALIALVLGIFVVPRATVSLAQSAFPDVLDSHPNGFAIQELKKLGFVSGYSDGTFRPEQLVNRAEAITIFFRASGLSAEGIKGEVQFKDVAKTDWFYPAVHAGAVLQKIKGYEDGTFRPNQTMNFVEAISTGLSFFKLHTLRVNVEARIYDGLDTNAWYAKRAQLAKNLNLIEPDATGKIDPGAAMTRATLAELVYRIHTVAKQSGKPFSITRGWITTAHAENNWKLAHPRDWLVFRGVSNSALWKPTPKLAFFTRVFPDGGSLSISHLPGIDGTPNAYFSELQARYKSAYGDSNVKVEQSSTNGQPSLKIRVPGKQILDFVLRLPDGNYLALYGTYGDSSAGDFVARQLEASIDSYEYIEKPKDETPPIAERMERLREAILVKGKATEILAFFKDRKLISTDAIGIGTGPVDYHFSSEAGHTIKVERNSNTILNIREGETTKF